MGPQAQEAHHDRRVRGAEGLRHAPRRLLREAAKTLQDPQVKAVVYFNSDEQAENARDKRRAYSVNGDKHATSALRELATTLTSTPATSPSPAGLAVP